MQPIERGNIRLAATILLLRQSPELEVFMVKRPGRGDFPDLHVFPGGKVDDADHVEEICDGLTDAAASKMLGIEAGGLRFWVAAIRECFEEAGVLLAHRNGEPFHMPEGAEGERLLACRHALAAGELDFLDFCRSEDLMLDCDAVQYFSYWLTPKSAPRRFDTRFFMATLPAGQQTVAHEGETADSDWIAPSDALARGFGGEWLMIDPTVVTLQSVARFPTIDEARDSVAAGTHLPKLTPSLNAQGMQRVR